MNNIPDEIQYQHYHEHVEAPRRRGPIIFLSILLLAAIALAVWGFGFRGKNGDKAGNTNQTQVPVTPGNSAAGPTP